VALQVRDLDAARAFYGGVLDCTEGRSPVTWVALAMKPQLRFDRQPGTQWTMFFRDPSGNPTEVKGFESLGTTFDA
jgi:extradiol dioxygenase family protein